MLLCCGFGCCFAFDVPPVTAPSIGVCVGPWLAPVWREARQDAEASSVRPGMACRWTPTQARSAGYPSSRFCFCDEGRSCREAALFGYFLALLPKSNSPVGEKPRLHFGKAEQRVTSVLPSLARLQRTTETPARPSMAGRSVSQAMTLSHRLSASPHPRYALLRGATRGERVGLIQGKASPAPPTTIQQANPRSQTPDAPPA